MNQTDTKRSDPIDVAVEELEAWKRRLTITVDAKHVLQARAKERKKLSKKLRLKGFRAGKVPTHIVEQKYGDLVDQRTVQSLVEDAYREAVRRQSLDPIGAPEFGQVNYAQGENLTFQVDVEIMPILNLKRTGGFKISRPKVSVADDDVEGVLQRFREERGVWEPSETPPEKGDLVAVRITNLDEAASAGGSEESSPTSVGTGPAGEGAGPAAKDAVPAQEDGGELYRFPLGGGYAIEDVEKAVKTLSPSESGTFSVRFPDDFGDTAMAGQTRQLQIDLVESKRRRLAPLDDDFASQVSEFETLEDLRRQIREDLLRRQEEESEQRVRDEILDSIVEANPFEVPDSLVEGYLDRILGSDRDAAETREAEAAEARRSVRPIAQQQLKRELVLEHLIQDLGIEVSDAQVDAHIATNAERRGVDAKELRRQWLRQGGLESVRRRVVIDGAFEHLEGLSTVE
jgi:trigger factor